MQAVGKSEVVGLAHALSAHTLPQGQAGVPKVDDTGFQIGSPEHELLRSWQFFLNLRQWSPWRARAWGGRQVRWQEFLRRREMDERAPAANGAGYGVRIEFAEPVQGPMAVGYASHFGMGGFEADGGTE